MKGDRRYEQTLDAILALHADSTVTLDQTAERLHGLLDEIEMLLDAIRTDIKKRDADA